MLERVLLLILVLKFVSAAARYSRVLRRPLRTALKDTFVTISLSPRDRFTLQFVSMPIQV